jgi:hypothetical protein
MYSRNNCMQRGRFLLKNSAVSLPPDAPACEKEQRLQPFAVPCLCLVDHLRLDASHRRLTGPLRWAQRMATWPSAHFLPNCTRLRAVEEQVVGGLQAAETHLAEVLIRPTTPLSLSAHQSRSWSSNQTMILHLAGAHAF